MKWIYPTTWAVITTVLVYTGNQIDALGSCLLSIFSAMACFVKEFEE